MNRTLTSTFMLLVVVMGLPGHVQPLEPLETSAQTDSRTDFPPAIKTEYNVKKLGDMEGVGQRNVDRFWEVLREQGESAKKENVGISFHGRVIDQYGNPVVGASIDFGYMKLNENILSEIMHLGIEKAKPRFKVSREITTDSEGVFFIDGIRGVRAYINNIDKQGCIFQQRRSYTYAKRRPETLKQASIENPEVFVMWKKGGSQALIKVDSGGTIKKKNQLTPRTLHIIKHLVNEEYYQPQGDFLITAYNQGPGRDEKGHILRKTFDWWVSIEAVDGDLQFTDDVWLYEAPEAGYKKSLRIERKADGSDWTGSTGDLKIYFKTHGNYGSALIEFDPYSNGDMAIYIRNLLINPTGSRNLEYDESKKIHIRGQ